ncbi:MAG: hypothetical protein LWW83_07300, partial [Azonexaceae bacterium]|nr:hypothetical protein [Azonexaceae bacterium]
PAQAAARQAAAAAEATPSSANSDVVEGFEVKEQDNRPSPLPQSARYAALFGFLLLVALGVLSRARFRRKA